jgi:hypothetical protein
VQGFEAAFRHANASKDFRRAEQLVWWSTRNPKQAKTCAMCFAKAFGHPVRRIDIGRFSWAQAIYPNISDDGASFGFAAMRKRRCKSERK